MDKLKVTGMVEMKNEELSNINGGIIGLVVLAARGIAAAAKIPAVQKTTAVVLVSAGVYIGWDLGRK